MKKTISIVIIAILAGALLFSGGILVGKMLNKPETKCKTDRTTKEKVAEARNIKTYSFHRLKDYGNIEEADDSLLDVDGYIEDSYFNIEELKDVKMKGHIAIPPTDIGGSNIYFLTEDNRMFVFGADCDTVDYKEYKIDNCVTPIKTPKKVDSIKAYMPYDSEFSAPILLYYSGDEIYDIDWNKVDINKRVIFRDEYLNAYPDHTLFISSDEEDITIEVDDKPIKAQYIAVTEESYNEGNSKYYVIDESDILYVLSIEENGKYKIEKLDNVTGYDFSAQFDLEDEDLEFYCDGECNFLVEVENGADYNFTW